MRFHFRLRVNHAKALEVCEIDELVQSNFGRVEGAEEQMDRESRSLQLARVRSAEFDEYADDGSLVLLPRAIMLPS